ncbi:hypothetical protein [Mangrovicoccus sp. HB161399]|uniref:hypothetical protein n=1 Tax=Mangrovicoccus sp. HB161399 TaxID=2720392 RepID=UPI0015563103|nr:hypothetical protein [Mangrovicoccus sp. HB161399]
MALIERTDDGGLRLNGTIPILTLVGMICAGVVFAVKTSEQTARNAADIRRIEVALGVTNADIREQRTALQAGQLTIARVTQRLDGMDQTLAAILIELREVRKGLSAEQP